VVCGLAAVTVAGCTHGATPAPATPPPAPPLGAARATALSSELSAGSPAALASALAIPDGVAVNPSAAAQIAAEAPIEFDLSTFHQTGATTATVAGHVAHPPAGTGSTWTFKLQYVSGTWKIVDAEPA
jgi:hypothetical protein